MNFREWLLFSEIPYPLMHVAQTIQLPDDKRENIPVKWDGVDMKFEDYWKNPLYKNFDWKRLQLQGFNAKLPFASNYLTFNASTRSAKIGPPLEEMATAPHDWYYWAKFSLGNTIVYFARDRIYEPTQATQYA